MTVMSCCLASAMIGSMSTGYPPRWTGMIALVLRGDLPRDVGGVHVERARVDVGQDDLGADASG